MASLMLKWLEQQLEALYSWRSRFGSYVNARFRDLTNDVDYLIDDIYSVQRSIRDIKDWVDETVLASKDAILSAVEDDMIKPLSLYVDALLMDVRARISGIYEDLGEITTDLSTVFDFIGHIDDIIDARVDGFKDKIIGWIEDKFISIVEHVLEQEIKK